MSTHISKLFSAAFYHMHNISPNCRFLSSEDAKSLVHAFITLHLYYCNSHDSCLFGLPASHQNKIQRILNAKARLVCRAPRYFHVTPLMRELHLLPIRQRVHFKILLFIFKAIHDIGPELHQGTGGRVYNTK